MLRRVHHPRTGQTLTCPLNRVACSRRPSRRTACGQLNFSAMTRVPFLICKMGVAGRRVLLLFNNLIEAVSKSTDSQVQSAIEGMLEKKSVRIDVFGL